MISPETISFHLRYLTAFLGEFFASGITDLRIEVRAHNCQSGLWWEARWVNKEGRVCVVSSMRGALMWERLIKKHLQQQEEEKGGEG